MRAVLFRSPWALAWRSASILVLCALALPVAAARADLAPGTWTTNGWAFAAVTTPGATYVGGYFDRQQARTGGAVLADAGSGELVPPIPGVVGSVSAAVPDGTGGWFLGGAFTHVGGERRQNLAHVRRDGTVDPRFDPRPNAARVEDLALIDGTLYVAGPFTRIAGVERHTVAALRASDGTDLGWDARVEDGGVRSFARDGQRLFLGGSFARVAGESRPGLAAVDVQTRNLTSWSAPDASRATRRIVIAGGRIYQCAGIDDGGGELRLTAVRLDTGESTSWRPETDRRPEALATDGTTVYVGGAFERIAGQPRRGLAAFDGATGALREDWKPGSGGDVTALGVGDGTVFVGSTGGTRAVDAASGTARDWSPLPNGRVEIVAPGNDEVLVGGDFSGAGRTLAQRSHLLRVLPDGTLDTDFDPGLDSGVEALAVDDGRLYLSGAFVTAGGRPRTNLAAFDLDSGTLTPWTAPTFSTGFTSRTLAAARGSVFVGGDFIFVDGALRQGLVALDGHTGAPRPWNVELGNGRLAHALVNTGDAIWPVRSGPVGGVPGRALRIDPATGTVTDGGARFDPGFEFVVDSTATDVLVGTEQPGGELRAYDRLTGAGRRWGSAPPDGPGVVKVGGSTAYGLRGLQGDTALPEHELRAYAATTGTPVSWSAGTATGRDFSLLAAGPGTLVIGGRDLEGVAGRPTGPFAVLSDPAAPPGRVVPDVFAPTIDVTHPADGQTVAPGDAAPRFSCADEPGGTGVATCEQDGPTPTTPGEHPVAVRATDRAGNERVVRRTVVVAGGTTGGGGTDPDPGSTPALPFLPTWPPVGRPVGPSPSPAPGAGGGAAAPARSVVRAALDRGLRSAAGPLRRMRTRRAVTIRATLPAGGRATLTVTARHRGRTVTVARGTARRETRGSYRLRVRRTSVGGRVLRGRGSVTLRARLQLRPTAGEALVRTRSVRVARG